MTNNYKLDELYNDDDEAMDKTFLNPRKFRVQK